MTHLAPLPRTTLAAAPWAHVYPLACRDLWRRVLVEALREAAGEARWHLQRGRYRDTALARACGWFDSADAREVADLAGIGPDGLRERAEPVVLLMVRLGWQVGRVDKLLLVMLEEGMCRA